MDGNQPTQTPQFQPVQPAQPSMPMQPGVSANQRMQTTAVLPNKSSDTANLIKTISIIVLSLVSVTFIGLFIWMNNQYLDASTDVEGQIKTAVEKAVLEQKNQDYAVCDVEKKYPLTSFVGPADYGLLSFEYPKTWSVYIAADASYGGDFAAYFSPLVVNTISNATVNSLRFYIYDRAYEDIIGGYRGYVDNMELSAEAITVYGTAGMRYTGRIPGTEFNGVIVIFRIRDKTVVMQTDAMLFVEDFDALLSTVQFNA